MLRAQHLGASRLVSAGRGSTSGSGRYLAALDGARARFGPPLMQHLGASRLVSAGTSRLVSAGRGSTSGSGRYPSAFRGPPLDAARRSTSLAARFCWQGQHFRLSLDAARRSTWEPRGSFLLAGAALQALDGTRARFGAPLLMLPGAALGSLAARFCWQGHTHTLDTPTLTH